LEQRVLEAESRAEEAEDKVRSTSPTYQYSDLQPDVSIFSSIA
jgi:hypothetical protein